MHLNLNMTICLCLLESDPLNWWLSKIEVWHVLDLACHANITLQVLKLLPANVVSANLDSILPSNDQHISISTICFWINAFFSTHILITLLVHPQSLPWFTWKLCFPSSESPFRIMSCANFQLVHHVGVGPIHWKYRHPLMASRPFNPCNWDLKAINTEKKVSKVVAGVISERPTPNWAKAQFLSGCFFPTGKFLQRLLNMAWKWFGNQQKHQKNTNTKKLYQWFQHLNWWLYFEEDPLSLKPPTTRWIRLILHTWF